MEFGKTITSFREKWGIEQKDLAKAIGVSKTYISLVESGSRKPSMRMLTKIAAYFEVPIHLFVYEASKATSKSPRRKKEKEALEVVDSIILELATFLVPDSKAVRDAKRRLAEKPKKARIRKKKSP